MYCSRIALNSSWPAVSRTRTEETKVFSYCENLQLLWLLCVLHGLSASAGLGPIKSCKIWWKHIGWTRWFLVTNQKTLLDPTHHCVPTLGGDGGKTTWILLSFSSTKQWPLNLGSRSSDKIQLKLFHSPPSFHLQLSVPHMEKPKTGRVSKCQLKCQGQSTNCMVKQSW